MSLTLAADLQNLRGLALYESTAPVNEWAGLTGGISFAGGSDMMIAGHGFQDEPGNNKVVMSTSAFIGETQEFSTPGFTSKFADLNQLRKSVDTSVPKL